MLPFLKGHSVFLFVLASQLAFVALGFEQLTYGSGDHVCDRVTCEENLIEIESCSDFSLLCDGYGSCQGSQIVVHSGSALNANGIDCAGENACANARILVYSSDLSSQKKNSVLKCDLWESACANMQLTLVDSSLELVCGEHDCSNLQVQLFGSSKLELFGSFQFYSSRPLTIFLFDDSKLVDNGVTGYLLFSDDSNASCSDSKNNGHDSAVMDIFIGVAVGVILFSIYFCAYVFYNPKKKKPERQSDVISSDSRGNDLEQALVLETGAAADEQFELADSVEVDELVMESGVAHETEDVDSELVPTNAVTR